MKDKQLTRLALFFFFDSSRCKNMVRILRVKSYRMIRREIKSYGGFESLMLKVQ